MTNFTELLEHYPRLRDWCGIGQVQRAELEAFVQELVAQNTPAYTYDGVAVMPDDTVWVLSSTGKPVATKVQPFMPVTDYYLFGQIPVAESFSSEQAAQLYIRHNK